MTGMYLYHLYFSVHVSPGATCEEWHHGQSKGWLSLLTDMAAGPVKTRVQKARTPLERLKKKK